MINGGMLQACAIIDHPSESAVAQCLKTCKYKGCAKACSGVTSYWNNVFQSVESGTRSVLEKTFCNLQPSRCAKVIAQVFGPKKPRNGYCHVHPELVGRTRKVMKY